MELGEAVRRRRAVRRFADRPVGAAALDRVVGLAVRGPTAGGSQGRELLVLRDPEARLRFWRAASDDVEAPDPWLAGMLTAPVVVLCLGRPGAYAERYARPDKARARADLPGPVEDPGSWPVPWWDVDTGMAALLLLLGAVDEGLAGCVIGVPGPRWSAVRAALGVPADRRLVAAVVLGHPAAEQPPPRRNPPAARLVHDGRFGVPWPEGG